VAADPKGLAYGNPCLLVPAPGVPVRARGLSVYDGDTITCAVVDPGSLHLRALTVRMAGYDAPEMRRSPGTKESKTEAARRIQRANDCKRQLIAHALNKDVYLVVQGRGKYGRTIAKVYENPNDARRQRRCINDTIATMPGCSRMNSKGRRQSGNASG